MSKVSEVLQNLNVVREIKFYSNCGYKFLKDFV